MQLAFLPRLEFNMGEVMHSITYLATRGTPFM